MRTQTTADTVKSLAVIKQISVNAMFQELICAGIGVTNRLGNERLHLSGNQQNSLQTLVHSTVCLSGIAYFAKAFCATASQIVGD